MPNDNLITIFQKNTPGYSFLLTKNNKVLVKGALGLANLKNKIKNTTKTNFRLCSLTKPFTAFAILLLVEKKYLSLENTLPKYFSDAPSFWKKITIKNLLTHTSGLPDYEIILAQGKKQNNNLYFDNNDALRVLFRLDKPLFLPGQKAKYSESGFVLLALIIEKISGKTYAEFLRNEIFLPLNMKSTFVLDKPDGIIPNRAIGYQKIKNEFRVFDEDPLNYVLGNEGIYSSVEDLWSWDKVWQQNNLISYQRIKKAMTPYMLTNGLKGKYGYSWLIGKYKNKKIVYHDGEWVGFRGIILKIPQEKITVVVLSNLAYWNTEEDRLEVAFTILRRNEATIW